MQETFFAESHRKFSDLQLEESKTPQVPSPYDISPSSQQLMARSTAPSFEGTPPASKSLSSQSSGVAFTANPEQQRVRFDSKPSQSKLLGTPVQLLTNQYRLKLSQELSVWQYDVTVLPDHMSDAFIMQGIFKAIKRKVDMILGLYVTSGRAVFTTTELNENVLITTDFRGIKYDIIINAENKKFFSGKQLTQAKMEDHNIIHNLLNIIVKQAFRETNLR